MPPRSLDEIVDLNAGVSFPGAALEGSGTALCLFAAAWHGRQDAYWLAQAGLQATCVDRNRTRLGEMAAIYPAGWRFHHEDVFQYTQRIVGSERFDVVTLDPFTNLVPRCVAHVARWCELARNLVVLGTLHDSKVKPPDGWRITDVRKRSDGFGGVFWTVLEP